MSINLGNEGIAAVKELRGSAHFQGVRDALHKQFIRSMHAALEAETTVRNDAVGYARALRDLWIAFESATTDKAYNQVVKPGAAAKSGTVVEKSSV